MNSTINHSKRCRHPAPILRLSWQRKPELWCGGCGRAVSLPEPTKKKAT